MPDDERDDRDDREEWGPPGDEGGRDDWDISGGEDSDEDSASEGGAFEASERRPSEIGPDDRTAAPPPGERAGRESSGEHGSGSGEQGGESGAPGGGSGEHDGAPGGGSGGDVPLSELRQDVDERRERDVEDDFEELFDEVDVGTVDEEAVWEELSESADEPMFVGDAETAERDVTVVEKRLCHKCPHFGDPPELHCTHEGTTIEAEVDTEHFRVADCPIVAQRENMDVEATDFSSEDS